MIRESVSTDYDKIYEIGETFQSNFRNIYNLKELNKNDYFHILVYLENNEVLAFLLYTNLYNTVELLDVIVLEQHRNKRIATFLIDYMITNLNPNSVIYLEVATNNNHALKLYEKFGFKTIHTRKGYYDGIQDAYVMERNVNYE